MFISFLCNSALSFGFEMQTANKIIDGDIILDLLKPIKYRTMLFFKVIGNAGIEFIITLIVIGTTYLFLIGINSLPIMRCLLFIISLFLGQGVKFHIQYLCSLLCFYTDNSYGILKCREVLTNFLSGALIPLALFPSVIQDIISVFPFPSIVYIPSSIFLGAFTFQESVESILFQLLWNVILFIIGSIVWKRAISVISLYGG